MISCRHIAKFKYLPGDVGKRLDGVMLDSNVNPTIVGKLFSMKRNDTHVLWSLMFTKIARKDKIGTEINAN